MAQTDIFWQAVRDHLGYGPTHLEREADLWKVWSAPDLLLSQTCGLPYRMRLHETVQLVGTPDYDLPGCPPGYYNSVLITHCDSDGDLASLAGRRVVINQIHSQSGHAALRNHCADLGMSIGPVTQSGSHAASVRLVAARAADLAAIDAQSWRLIQQFDAVAASVREVARTTPTPGLPFITGPSQNADEIRQALAAALAGVSTGVRASLGMRAIHSVPKSAYLSVPTPAEAAVFA